MPTILAQIDPSTIEAASDAGVGVLALIALIVLGLGAWRLGDRLFATVDKLTVAAQDAQDKAEAAQKAASAAQDALTTSAGLFATSMAANTTELKAQTAVLLDLRADLRTQIEAGGKATVTAIEARMDASDVEFREAVTRIENGLAALTEKYEHGEKVRHGEVVDLLKALRADVASLKPPPPPTVVKPPEPLEKQEPAAA